MPRSPWCLAVVATVIALSAPALAQAKATASQRAQARRVYAPVAAFKRAIAPEAARSSAPPAARTHA